MMLMSVNERAFAGAVSRIVYCNPFLPERIEFEREALGEEFEARDLVWHTQGQLVDEHPNLARISQRVEELAEALRGRMTDGASPTREQARLYEDLVLYLLYYRNQGHFYDFIRLPPEQRRGFSWERAYGELARDMGHFWDLPSAKLAAPYDPAHLFALFYQIRRAFEHIFGQIVGASMPIARLRAAAWQSIFTHDLRRFRRALYDKMGDIATLVTGPSGTGKEVVARAIGFSRYIPFDPDKLAFAQDFEESFYALNIAALSPTLIESELFGHRRGAFTGAIEDRPGWLEVCRPLGTVFLDEVGDIVPAIQVKLLRVLQTRTFQRLGDTATLQFQGKLVAATNRHLAAEIRAGRLREDFYYRLCSDIITTPSLREQLQDSPGELRTLALFIARRILGDEAEVLANEVTKWVGKNLGPDYAWPGNFRELEQCVRNVLIRGAYSPHAAAAPREDLARLMESGDLRAEDVLCRYCKLVYAKTGSLSETARRLGMDRRTVKAKIEEEEI